jgi:hypothetical protein
MLPAQATKPVTARRVAMPRDLDQEKPAPPVPLTESPNSVTTERSESPNQEEEASPTTERRRQFVIIPEDQYVKPPANLHPYTRPLTISDVDSCVALEDAAFANPEERATREKVILSAKSSISPLARDSLPILEDGVSSIFCAFR